MMKRHEAYWLLNELRSSCTKTEQEAIDIALNDIEFVDLMGDKLRTARHGGWISVFERLPEPGARVLATDGAFVGEFYINKRGKWQRYNVNDSSLLLALDILWWMPLPEAPKEEE